MNLRSESREREGNLLGLMNQFQKNPFTWSPSISTRVRRYEMLALTLSTSALMLPTLWVWSKETDSGTETRKSWLGKSVHWKSGSSFPSEIQRCWSPDEIAVGRNCALTLWFCSQKGSVGSWGSLGLLQVHCFSTAHWPPSPSRVVDRPTEPSACAITTAWGIVEDSEDNQIPIQRQSRARVKHRLCGQLDLGLNSLTSCVTWARNLTSLRLSFLSFREGSDITNLRRLLEWSKKWSV